jgi:hypothetical protein
MTMKRIHLALSPAQIKSLDKLAKELGMDRLNAIRYCIALGTGKAQSADRPVEGIKIVT